MIKKQIEEIRELYPNYLDVVKEPIKNAKDWDERAKFEDSVYRKSVETYWKLVSYLEKGNCDFKRDDDIHNALFICNQMIKRISGSSIIYHIEYAY